MLKPNTDLGRVSYVLLLVLASTIAACSKEEVPDTRDADMANVDAMTEEHANDANEPSPAVQAEPKRSVISEELPYAEVANELVYGHFALPEDMIDPLPAVIVIHEWWGLNDNVRAMADRLAGEGYIVLAVDLFGGTVAETPPEARQQMIKVVENPGAAVENLRQAINFVNEVAQAPSVATLGWCFGGGWSLNAALEFPNQLDATVVFYGQVTSDMERLEPLSTPVLGIFGSEDRGISVESVRSFEATADELEKDVTIHVYPGAGHAFANPTGRNYDASAAQDAWEKTLDFLRQELSSAGSASSSDGG